MKRMLNVFAGMIVVMLMSCVKESYGVNQYVGSGGDFLVENVTQDLTYNLSGAINVGEDKVISVHNGDKLIMTFRPIEKFKDYKFETTYTLHDGTQVKGVYSYEYNIADVPEGKYNVTLAAKYDGSRDYITLGCTFILNVLDIE